MHSLRARLVTLGVLILAGCIVIGILLMQFYRESATARLERAQAIAADACGQIAGHYAFLVRGWQPPGDPLQDPRFRQGLGAVVAIALANQPGPNHPGLSGGIVQEQAGALTGGGSDAAATLALRAAQDDEPQSQTISGDNETTVLAACPLGGPVSGMAAWTQIPVSQTAGYDRLRLGLFTLLALLMLTAGWLALLLITWSRHLAGIERALAGDTHDLPELPATGERELDRIVAALNQAARRLAAARRQSDELAARVAAAERLAALGRVAAGVAHEIRNPIAAMRLRAENALAAGPDRTPAALAAILQQVGRLDGLVSQLLAMTQRQPANPRHAELDPLLRDSITDVAAQAAAAAVTVEAPPTDLDGWFDPQLAAVSLRNLLLNAIRHAARQVSVNAERSGQELRITVTDDGPGVPPNLRSSLFEPFVTGHPDGTGLGLPIAREMAQAQAGRLELADPGGDGRGASFVLILPAQMPTRTPCPPS